MAILSTQRDYLPQDITQVLSNFSSDDDGVYEKKLARYKQSTEHIQAQRLFDIQSSDLTHRIWIRMGYSIALGILLFLQNAAVFLLVAYALWLGTLSELQQVFSVVIPATLIETTYLVKVVVHWLFTDIDYSKQNSQK